MDSFKQKRRAKGTESIRKENKRKRESGEQYNNYKHKSVAAKEPPHMEVSFVEPA